MSADDERCHRSICRTGCLAACTILAGPSDAELCLLQSVFVECTMRHRRVGVLAGFHKQHCHSSTVGVLLPIAMYLLMLYTTVAGRGVQVFEWCSAPSSGRPSGVVQVPCTVVCHSGRQRAFV